MATTSGKVRVHAPITMPWQKQDAGHFYHQTQQWLSTSDLPALEHPKSHTRMHSDDLDLFHLPD
jgi:hypothetical protein